MTFNITAILTDLDGMREQLSRNQSLLETSNLAITNEEYHGPEVGSAPPSEDDNPALSVLLPQTPAGTRSVTGLTGQSQQGTSTQRRRNTRAPPRPRRETDESTSVVRRNHELARGETRREYQQDVRQSLNLPPDPSPRPPVRCGE